MSITISPADLLQATQEGFLDGVNPAMPTVSEIAAQRDEALCKLAEAEAAEKELRQIVANQDAANLAATERLGMAPGGPDTADDLADEIEKLRKDLLDLAAK